jgi:cobalt/nickel transport system permease protein
MIIDKLAYNSKLRKINPLAKLLFAALSLIICIAANSFAVSIFIALTMFFLIIFMGKTSHKSVFHLMTVPAVFVIMGAIAIAISIGSDSSGMLACIRISSLYFGIGREGLMLSIMTMFKCFGAVSCMYFLSLTTPMVDLFTLLRKSIIPNFIVEITELIYRYIFVLYDVSNRIHCAQDARLGYINLKTSYHSTATLASNLFIRSFTQAEKTYTAMQSRGYDGEINVIMPKFNSCPLFNIFSAAYIILLIAAAILCRKAGI